MEWVLILMFYICTDVLFLFLALFAKLLNRGGLHVVGNISISALMHDQSGAGS